MARAGGLRIAANALVCCALLTSACNRSAPPESPAPARPDPAAAAPAAGPNEVATGSGHDVERVRVSFRHINLHVDDETIVEIRRLEGQLVSRTPGQPPTFDDEQSFTLEVRSAEIALGAGALTHLVNRALLSAGAPLTDVTISIAGDRMRQKGTLKKGVHVPFDVEATPGVTDDGRIRLHPTHVKAAGVPAGGIMKVFGIELDDLVALKNTHGVEIVDNDVIVDPQRVLPAPTIRGRLTAVRLEQDRLVEIIGDASLKDTIPPAPGAVNYMAYRGGALRFGKLTMSDADMQLIDADPSDPFDFYPDRYLRQLVAGYSKNTPAGGLRVQMPDYDQTAGTDLRPPGAPRPHPPTGRPTAKGTGSGGS
jgi:hypothetical protein